MNIKNLLTIASLLMAFQLFGQSPLRNWPAPSTQYSRDSEIAVIYTDSLSEFYFVNQPPAFFVNGTFYDNTIIKSLDSKVIESVNVEKG